MKKFNTQNIHIKSDTLKIVGLIGAGVAFIGTLASKELQRRENIDTINKVVDERLVAFFDMQNNSSTSN